MARACTRGHSGCLCGYTRLHHRVSYTWGGRCGPLHCDMPMRELLNITHALCASYASIAHYRSRAHVRTLAGAIGAEACRHRRAAA